MARITEVRGGEETRGGSGQKQSTAAASSASGARQNTASSPPPPSSWFIFAIPLASIAIGVYAHYTSIHQAPYGEFAQTSALSSATLREQLGVGETLLGVEIAKYDEQLRLLYVLNGAFQVLCASALGRGLFTAVVSVAIPGLGGLLVEGLKGGSSVLLGPVALTLVAALGQLVMIGCANNVVVVPLFALASWRQVNKAPREVRPLPSPPSGQVTFAGAVLAASLLPFFATLAVDSDAGPAFFLAATAFQFFPLFWIPLWFIPKQQQRTSRPPTQPRLAAARMYSLMAYASVPLWWYALYNAGPPLWRAWRGGGGGNPGGIFGDDISRLIWYDTLSTGWSLYAIVLLQAEVDLRAVQLGAQRVHRARLFIEDVVFGSSGLLLLGPGFGMGTYFARREVLAEKARFGMAPVVGSGGAVAAADRKAQ